MLPATSKLQVLTLYNNQLTGTIPSTIGNAKSLQNFDLTSNAIFGTIPPSLGNLTQLKYAVLKFNKLTGALPETLEVLAGCSPAPHIALHAWCPPPACTCPDTHTSCSLVSPQTKCWNAAGFREGMF